MNYVYMLRCADDTYYTGWTCDLAGRLAAHNRGLAGAKYTRSRRPVRLVYCESLPDKSAALKREAAIKRMTRAEKQRLLDGFSVGEQLTVYDADEQEAGVLPRAAVHRLGLRHHVCHLWLVQEQNGVLGHWLQQRAEDRPLYPGLYDLAATGHIDPGETPLEGVLREAREEIGLRFTAAQILPLGAAEQKYARPDGGFDNELVYAFAARLDGTPDFALGPEVKRMVWTPFEEYLRAENGAAQIQLGGETVSCEALCCLHKEEWALFARHLERDKKL